MKRLKRLVTGKGKAPESSSSPVRQKRRMLVDEPSDEEMSDHHDSENSEDEEKPTWKVGTLLYNMPKKWQLELFKDKMNEAENIKKQLIGERKTVLSDFEGFNLVESFDRLGWRQGLVWNNNDDPEVYLDGIIEWLGTLERTLGPNPPETIKMTGTVNGKKVVMSFATLDKITRFDTGGHHDYLSEDVLTGAIRGENWGEMVENLFVFDRELINLNVKLERNSLRLFSRLLISIVHWNIVPRTSDKAMVRFNDVIVLYALSTGNLALSLRQIIMLNIWEARNKRNKMVIPHPRLISRLIKSQRAIPQGAPMVEITQFPFSLARLGRVEWIVRKTPRAVILLDARSDGYLLALKPGFTVEDVRADLEDRMRRNPERENAPIPERRDNVMLGREDEDASQNRGARPSFYTNWSPYEQQMWDLTARRHEEQRRYERGMVYAHELELRRRHEYSERVRHYEDFVQELPYVETPPQYDYQAMPEETLPHYPQSHDSDWLPRHSSAARLGEGSSSATASDDPFETRSMYTSLMESIFGPRQPQ